MEPNFRTCIIGGFNKNDVMDYIRELENKIQSLEEVETNRKDFPSESEKSPSSEEFQGCDIFDKGLDDDIEEVEASQEWILEKQRLEQELEELRMNKQRYEEDYEAIKKVLLDARVDAEVIITKAQEQADQLLAEAEESIRMRRKEAALQLKDELETKGVEILTSRYKLQNQLENLDKVRKDITGLQDNMKRIIEDIPVGIEMIISESIKDDE